VSCGTGTLVKSTAWAITLTSCSCRCWSCSDCGPRRQWQCEQEIVAGEPTTFITFGCQPNRYNSPEEARADMGRAMSKLAKRIRREWPDFDFQYAAYVEAFKSGWPHFHIACRAPYIPQPWLAKQLEELLGAPVCWITTAGTPKQVAKYLCKYLVKAPHQFGKSKRYWYSQNYRPQAVFDSCELKPLATFRYSREHISQIVAEMASPALMPIRIKDDTVMLVRVAEPRTSTARIVSMGGAALRGAPTEAGAPPRNGYWRAHEAVPPSQRGSAP